MIKMYTRDFAEKVHQRFAWMRENEPVCKARLSLGKNAYLITRYDDAKQTLGDNERFIKNPRNVRPGAKKNDMYWMPKTFRPLLQNMLNSDEPDHRRLRNLVHQAFTPKRIAGMKERIEEIADELLDRIEPESPFDLVEAFALPLPVTVIAELIGIPPPDRPRFFGWTRKIIVTPTPLNMMRAVPSLSALMKHLRLLAARRKVEPQDDLVSALARAEDEEGDRFTEDELIAMLFLLLVAGHETTVGLIGNGVLALLDHPEEFEKLRDNPDLMDSAVEEFLRYDGPLQTSEISFARESVELHNVRIPQGAIVLPAILSANRDERVFENADQLDITRSPNKHLAFGHGIHYCLGAPLARLEGRIAFTKLIERFPGLRLAVGRQRVSYLNAPILHRPATLPVETAGG